MIIILKYKVQAHVTGAEIAVLHDPSMLAVKVKIYGVIYNQPSSTAFDETSSYWSAPKSS